MEDKEITKGDIIKFFSTPYFDWYYRWEPIRIQDTDTYNNSDRTMPCRRSTFVLWKSKKTGKVIKKTYDYQI